MDFSSINKQQVQAALSSLFEQRNVQIRENNRDEIEVVTVIAATIICWLFFFQQSQR